MDFFKVRSKYVKLRNTIDIFPEFNVRPSKDLMIRGHDFYAVWDEEQHMWNRDILKVQEIVDEELWKKHEKLKAEGGETPLDVKLMRDFSSKSWSTFIEYLGKMSDNFTPLDSKLTFQNSEVKREDYISKRLPYALEAGDHSAFDEMLGTLYLPEELEKLLWAIGCIVSGDSINVQKFIALYGDPGSGKGTVIDIINMLFEGYVSAIDVEALTSRGDTFATDVFRDNPLVAFQQDTDLSRIDKNTAFNSIISHEVITMKEKYKSSYNSKANCFIFVGSNEPVKITNGKSGLLRRLIDVSPSGMTIPNKRYKQLKKQIKFELGAIAEYCLRFYQDRGPSYYDAYRPVSMQFRTDPFFNFVDYYRMDFLKSDGVSLKVAYTMYKEYINEGGGTQMQMYKFKEELKNYFKNFEDVTRIDGKQVRSWYSGFRNEKFTGSKNPKPVEVSKPDDGGLKLECTKSLLDEALKDYPAQYATEDGSRPLCKWANCKTTLKEIDTSKLHFLQLPKNYIRVDFDLKDETGQKSRELNLKAASEWPKTYMEFSKSGAGIHAYYIYLGDVNELSNSYADDIEIKVSTGNASARRKLTYCNDIPVATISSGLPLKEGRKLLNEERLKSEKALRNLIERNLNKEIHPGTKPSIDFIEKILNDAYDSGLSYDVSDMQRKVLSFAMHSTNQSDYCVKAVGRMKWMSKNHEEQEPMIDTIQEVQLWQDRPIVFFDCEVFPNLLIANWKYQGKDYKVVRMINPSPEDIRKLTEFRLIGFNCRKYDNHILYARILGWDNMQIYKLSQSIISDKKSSQFFKEAYNLSYTDILDFCSTKQSLKKWEIQLGIHHQELGLPWDEPVPEDLWYKVAEYCDNDVLATEAVFDANQADWTARQILADIAGMNVNSTTNQLTTKIIFGDNRQPQDQFNYRNMGDMSDIWDSWIGGPELSYPDFALFNHQDQPIFRDYIFEKGVSTYRGEVVGEGGYVYSEPGVYRNVALLDIASMHPSSIVAENLFGSYTARFKDLLDIRIAIKHKDYDKARTMLDGKLAPYLTDEKQAKQLSKALKIAINSVYGLTSAKFDNPFHDARNIDNIVAKRGALFMINLKHEVQAKGFRVAHIKTDSIKIPNATPEIIQFVMEYGKLYGYTFEHEATYGRMCLIDKAQYIAEFALPEYCSGTYGYVPEKNVKNPEDLTPNPGRWFATGDCFRTTYTFKKLFSGEDIVFKDLCETKTVTTALYLDMNEDIPQMAEDEQKRLEKLDKMSSMAPEDFDKALDKMNLTKDEYYGILNKLHEREAATHNYIFIGRAGSFCPIVKGGGGGKLMRIKDGKYYAAGGTIGYRWLEAELVATLEKENLIDRGYFDKLAADVVKNMEEAAKNTNETFDSFMNERSIAYV